jgi:hypothetical protein
VASTAGAGLTVNLSATTDAQWLVLSTEHARALEATTSLGESLLDDTPATGPGAIQVNGFRFNVAAFSSVGEHRGPHLIALTLLAPRQPASSLHQLVAIVDLLLAKEDSVKTVKAKLGVDDINPLGPSSSCDITVKKNDGNVTVSLGEGAEDIIRSMSFLDDSGNSFKGMQRGMGFSGKRTSTTYAFGNVNVTTVSIDYYSDIRKVQATFELDNLPIVGLTTPHEQEPKRAVTVTEVVAAAVPAAKPPAAPAAAGAGAAAAPAPAPAAPDVPK